MQFPVMFSIIHGSDVIFQRVGPGIFDSGPVKASFSARISLRSSSAAASHSSNET